MLCWRFQRLQLSRRLVGGQVKLARGGRQETVFLTEMNGCPVTLEKGDLDTGQNKKIERDNAEHQRRQ
jgi:hypothetical protein